VKHKDFNLVRFVFICLTLGIFRNLAVKCSSQWKGRHSHPRQEWSWFWKCLFLVSYWL